MKLNVYLSGEIHTDWRQRIKDGCDAHNLSIAFTSAVTDHGASDAALGKPYITLHNEDIIHPLKEVDAQALAWATTPEQVVEILQYTLEG